jgi:hypothetical protein
MFDQTIKADGVTLWLENGKFQRAWKDNGMHAVPVSIIEGKTPDEAVAYLNTHNPCSKCGKELDGKGGKHFAAHYCGECWDEYKVKNSRQCLMCKQPLWACCC